MNELGKKILLVEGKGDKSIIEAILKCYSVNFSNIKITECNDQRTCNTCGQKIIISDSNIEIIDCEGDNNLLKKLKALMKTAVEDEQIGIILDADKGYENETQDNQAFNQRWQQVKEILKHKYTIPRKINESGFISEGKNDINSLEPFKIGVWLMPDNSRSGMIEDFIIDMIDENAINFAKECVNEAKDKNITSFKETHHSKAIVHTYLAWQDEPGNHINYCLKPEKIAPQPTADLFVKWFKNLFELEEN